MGACFENGLCQKTGDILRLGSRGCETKLPEKGAVLAPWVRLMFTQGEQVITVSNKSSPDSFNAAVIQSFEYGHTDGFTARFVIQDQEGGAFVNVVQHMFKNWKEAEEGAKKYEIQFQFGWAKADCGVPSPDAVSPCIYAMVSELETNFANGKYTIEFTATDLCKRMTEGASELHQGTEDHPMCLKDAITKLMTNSESPNLSAVEFKRIENGIVTEAEFLDNDQECCPKDSKTRCTKGPRHPWRPESEDKLTVVRRWLRPYLSSNNKGWAVTATPLKPGGTLVIWEDRPPPCEAKPTEWWQSNCIGHYMINASKSSPVIEFNPKFRWTFDHLMSTGGNAPGDGGNVAGGTDPETGGKGNSKSQGRYDCEALSRAEIPSAGQGTLQASSQNMVDRNSDEATDKTNKGNAAANRADQRWFPSIFEATLVIVGDPCLCRPDEMFGRTVTLTMYNPFYIRTDIKDKNKYEWLAPRPMNCVITNSAWMVRGITHKIDLGNYTTTLHLILAEPGVDGPPCEPLGLVEDGWNPCTTKC